MVIHGSDNPPKQEDNPYVGPRPFEMGRPLFGRDNEIDDLYYLLSAERIVLLHSPSGAGKSSLIQAGLIPRLLSRFDVWGPTRVNLQPPEDLPAGVNRYVRSVILGFEQEIPETRRRSEDQVLELSLAEYVKGRPRRRSAPANIVLLFDQFEEILTVDQLAIEAKREFFDQLGELLLDLRIWALFALREDYLAQLDPYSEQVPTHLNNRFRLDLLGRDAAQEAIVRPAREAAEVPREWAPEAVDKLVRDLATVKVQQPDGTFREQLGRHVEPLQLQVVCRRLWERMPPDDLLIDVEDVQELGNVTEALSGYYAGEVVKISGDDNRTGRDIREWVDVKLITPDGIRGQVLRGAGKSEGLDNDLIARLVNTHLVRGEQRAGAVWYELAHDRLIEPVRDNNRQWFDDHLHQVQKVAKVWAAQDESPGLLLLGDELAAAKLWAAQNESSLTPVEQRFLEKSSAKQLLIDHERRQAKRLRRLLAAVVVVAVVALIIAGYAYRQKQNAQRSLRTSRGLLYVASQLQAWQAYAAGQYAQAGDYLASSFPLPGETVDDEVRSFDWFYLWHLMHDERQTLKGHTGYVSSVSFSPDGRMVSSGSDDGTVRLWNTESGKEMRGPDRAGAAVNSVSFSPDGRRLAGGCADKTVRIWDVESGKLLGQLDGHQSPVLSVSFSPDGLMIASGGQDKTVRLWDAGTGKVSHSPLAGHTDSILSVRFSPDGRMVASGGSDGTIRLWDTGSGNELRMIEGQGEHVTSLAFTKDSQKLASGNGDGVVRFWNVSSGDKLWESNKHSNIVNSVSFSPDDRKLVIGCADGTVRLLDTKIVMGGQVQRQDIMVKQQLVNQGLEEQVLKGHSASVRSVSFSPDGRTLVSGSQDRTLKLWDLTAQREFPKLAGHERDIYSVSFSPDGQKLASGSVDEKVRLWDLASGNEIWKSASFGATVNSAAFSADGQILACGNENGEVRLLDVGSGKDRRKLEMAGVAVKSVSFSRDGHLLAGGCADSTVKIWNVENGKLEEPLKGHKSPVLSVAFSPDGRMLASGSGDGTVRLWNVASRKEVWPPRSIGVTVNSVSFSPDGRMLASGSDDKTVRLWNVSGGEELRKFEGLDAIVISVTFSADGRTLASVTGDGKVKLLYTETGKILKTLEIDDGYLTSIMFSPDGRTLAGGVDNGGIVFWRGATDREIERQCVNCGLK